MVPLGRCAASPSALRPTAASASSSRRRSFLLLRLARFPAPAGRRLLPRTVCRQANQGKQVVAASIAGSDTMLELGDWGNIWNHLLLLR